MDTKLEIIIAISVVIYFAVIWQDLMVFNLTYYLSIDTINL